MREANRRIRRCKGFGCVLPAALVCGCSGGSDTFTVLSGCGAYSLLPCVCRLSLGEECPIDGGERRGGAINKPCAGWASYFGFGLLR